MNANMKKSFIVFLFLTAGGVWAAGPTFPVDPATKGTCENQSGSAACTAVYSDRNALDQPSDSQTRGLAVPNRLLENDFNIFVNPGQLANYGTAYLEGWRGSNAVWGGATIPLPFGTNQKIAVFLRRPLNANSALGSVRGLFNLYPITNAANSSTTAINPNFAGPATAASYPGFDGKFDGDTFGIIDNAKKGFGNVDLMYGLPLGKINLGLRMSYSSVRRNASAGTSATVATTESYNFDTTSHDFSAGVGAQIKDLGPGYLDVAMTYGYVSTNMSFSNALTASRSESLSVASKNPLILGGLVRYVMPFGEHRLIAAVNIDSFKLPLALSGKNVLNTSTHAIDATTQALNGAFDVAFHQAFTEAKLKVIYSTGFLRNATNYDFSTATAPTAATDIFGGIVFNNAYESTLLAVPVGIAAEHQTFETLKTRIGVRKNVVSNRYTKMRTATTSYEYNTRFDADDDLIMAMGLGWTPMQKVNVDIALNADVMNPSTLFAAISARYHY